jgi:hypothetical protein
MSKGKKTNNEKEIDPYSKGINLNQPIIIKRTAVLNSLPTYLSQEVKN